MIKHIVMWKLKLEAEGSNKAINTQKMKKYLEGLQDQIAEIQALEVGINIPTMERNYDIVLYAEFKNLYDLDTYQKHPAHLNVVDFVKVVTEARAAVDYME